MTDDILINDMSTTEEDVDVGPYEMRNQPVSKNEAVSNGASHELYRPRYVPYRFPHPDNPERRWGEFIDNEAERLNANSNRIAVVFFARGFVGLAVNCMSSEDCERKDTSYGMH